MHQLPADIVALDTSHLGRAEIICCYLIRGSVNILVDPGPTVCIPALGRELQRYGLTFAHIGAIILTHIHLDHGGAVGVLLRDYPQMTLYVHERGVPHLVDPTKLLASATRIYGDQMDVLWGAFEAVPAARIVALQGDETLIIGDQTFAVLPAPGHAIHHLMYVRSSDRVAFVGDMAGIRMPGYRYVRPATPPPDIDLDAWDASLDRLRAAHPSVICLTHYGPIFDIEPHLATLQAANWRWAHLVRDWTAQGLDAAEQLRLLTAQATADMGDEATDLGISAYQKGASITMSQQGLARYWQKRTPTNP
ncbi:MAG: hypothetical protein RLZZ297_125 [Chloroflexota bacterium]